MTTIIFKRGMVFAVIVLFVVAGIIPAVNSKYIHHNPVEENIEDVQKINIIPKKPKNDDTIKFAKIFINAKKLGDIVSCNMLCISLVSWKHIFQWFLTSELYNTSGTHTVINKCSSPTNKWLLFFDLYKRTWNDIDHAEFICQLWIDGKLYCKDMCEVP